MHPHIPETWPLPPRAVCAFATGTSPLPPVEGKPFPPAPPSGLAGSMQRVFSFGAPPATMFALHASAPLLPAMAGSVALLGPGLSPSITALAHFIPLPAIRSHRVNDAVTASAITAIDEPHSATASAACTLKSTRATLDAVLLSVSGTRSGPAVSVDCASPV